MTEAFQYYGALELDHLPAVHKLSSNIGNDFSKLSEDTAKMIYTNDFINACFYGDLEREILDFDISDDNIADLSNSLTL